MFMIDNYTVLEMEECLTSLLKYSAKLAGLANVVEVLESSFKGSLDRLQDSIVKTKQVKFLGACGDRLKIFNCSLRNQTLSDILIF